MARGHTSASAARVTMRDQRPCQRAPPTWRTAQPPGSARSGRAPPYLDTKQSSIKITAPLHEDKRSCRCESMKAPARRPALSYLLSGSTVHNITLTHMHMVRWLCYINQSVYLRWRDEGEWQRERGEAEFNTCEKGLIGCWATRPAECQMGLHKEPPLT